jgi:hypothetical protein
MSGAEKIVRGFNETVRYRGRAYHVQTEDSGRRTPHVCTHLFHGGTILATKEVKYDHLVDHGDWRDRVRALMREQHAAMRDELLAGDHDEQIVLVLSKLTATEPPPAPTPSETDLSVDEAAVSGHDLDTVLLDHVAADVDSDMPPSSRVPSSVVRAVGSEPPPSLDGLTVDTRIRPDTVLPILERIEELPQDAVGALLFRKADQHAGMVLIDKRRVCWAVAERMGSRLTDIVRKLTRPPLEPEVIEEVYLRCRKQHTPLGEALVDAGLVTPENLRRALRQHSAEALVRLAMMSGKMTSTFTPHRRVSYNARYTFPTPELLTTSCELRNKKLAAAARAELRRLLPPEATGMMFAISEGEPPLPVALQGSRLSAATDVPRLAQFCCSIQDVTGILVDSRRMVVHTAGEHAVVTWSRGPLAGIALCEEPSSVAYLYATLLRR